MRIAHLTTVDLSLRYLILPQLEAALEWGESIGISAPGEHVAELEERGIRHIALSSSTRGMSLGSDLRAMRQLWKVLKSEKPDILHTHNPKPGVYGRVLGRLAGVPIVVNTVHGLYATPDSSPIKRAWSTRLRRWPLASPTQNWCRIPRTSICCGDFGSSHRPSYACWETVSISSDSTPSGLRLRVK
jgi:hypothetical protein